jgi:hypothetical protein
MAKQTRSKTLNISTKQETPIKITIELDIVVSVRQELYSTTKRNLLSTRSTLGGSGCPDNKFSYVFHMENASVLSIAVEDFDQNNPEKFGKFTTCINDASPEPKVRIICLAKEDNPGGRVALELKFRDKDVFSSPMEFEHGDHGFLKLNTLAKLPI